MLRPSPKIGMIIILDGLNLLTASSQIGFILVGRESRDPYRKRVVAEGTLA